MKEGGFSIHDVGFEDDAGMLPTATITSDVRTKHGIWPVHN